MIFQSKMPFLILEENREILKDLSQFMQDSKSGIFGLIGLHGSGKTSILSHFLSHNNSIYWFKRNFLKVNNKVDIYDLLMTTQDIEGEIFPATVALYRAIIIDDIDSIIEENDELELVNLSHLIKICLDNNIFVIFSSSEIPTPADINLRSLMSSSVYSHLVS